MIKKEAGLVRFEEGTLNAPSHAVVPKEQSGGRMVLPESTINYVVSLFFNHLTDKQLSIVVHSVVHICEFTAPSIIFWRGNRKLAKLLKITKIGSNEFCHVKGFGAPKPWTDALTNLAIIIDDIETPGINVH